MDWRHCRRLQSAFASWTFPAMRPRLTFGWWPAGSPVQPTINTFLLRFSTSVMPACSCSMPRPGSSAPARCYWVLRWVTSPSLASATAPSPRSVPKSAQPPQADSFPPRARTRPASRWYGSTTTQRCRCTAYGPSIQGNAGLSAWRRQTRRSAVFHTVASMCQSRSSTRWSGPCWGRAEESSTCCQKTGTRARCLLALTEPARSRRKTRHASACDLFPAHSRLFHQEI